MSATISGRVYAQLRNDILSVDLPPGDCRDALARLLAVNIGGRQAEPGKEVGADDRHTL